MPRWCSGPQAGFIVASAGKIHAHTHTHTVQDRRGREFNLLRLTLAVM